MTGLGPMRRNTPTAGLEIILNVPPIDLYAKKLGLEAYIRIQNGTHSCWDGRGGSGPGTMRRWSSMIAAE